MERFDERLADKTFGDAVVGQLATFTAETVLAGDLKEKAAKVVYYRLKKGVSVENGPLLAEFRTKGRRLRIQFDDAPRGKVIVAEGKPLYLLFLNAERTAVSNRCRGRSTHRFRFETLPRL